MVPKERADTIIRKHVFWACGAGLIPVPLVDIAAVTAIQIDMLKQLSHLYGVRYSESQGKTFVTALSGSILARLGANALKLIPGIGSILGGVSMAAMSGASTYAIGQVAADQFARGTDVGNIDVDEARKTYEAEYEKGKSVAEEVSKNPDASRDVFQKLEKLGELRQKGILSEAEFEEQKKKLLEQI